MVEDICGLTFLQFKECGSEEDEIVGEERSFLPSEGPLFSFILQMRLAYNITMQLRVLRCLHCFEMKMGSRCSEISRVKIRNGSMEAIWKKRLCPLQGQMPEKRL